MGKYGFGRHLVTALLTGVLLVALAIAVTAALTEPANGQAKLPGYGFPPPVGKCACLLRNSSITVRLPDGTVLPNPIDCWLIDTTAHPFDPQMRTAASYDLAVRRWHLHARGRDYFPAGSVPEGEETLNKGYIPSCDAENWTSPHAGTCRFVMEAQCRANQWGTADSHDCEWHPELGAAWEQMTDWLVVNMRPGTCPSGVGAGFVPPPQPTPPPVPVATATPVPTVAPPPPADPCRPRGLCLDMFGTCSPCGGGPVATPTPAPTPRPSPTPAPTATPAPSPSPAPVVCPSPPPCQPCTSVKRIAVPPELRECLERLANLRPTQPFGTVTWRDQRRECVRGLWALVQEIGDAAYVPSVRSSGQLSMTLEVCQ